MNYVPEDNQNAQMKILVQALQEQIRMEKNNIEKEQERHSEEVRVSFLTSRNCDKTREGLKSYLKSKR